MADVEQQKVSFERDGNRLVGHFYTNGEPARAVVVTGSWTTVKEQMADHYARRLADAGFATLTFDFTNFGESEGEPRQRESPRAKIDDIVAAARWLAARDDVLGETVGGLAICASAGYMAHAITRGAPIASFATVAAWLHDAGTVGEAYGGDQGLAERKRDGEAALRAFEEHGEIRYVPAYSEDDPKAAMGEMVKAYYGDPSRGALPEWDNRFAVLSWPEWLDFDGLRPAPAITVPTLMVHSDDAAFPDNVRRFAAALGGPNEIVWREGSQLDFYDQPAQVEPAIHIASGHFRRTLKRLAGKERMEPCR